jgi:hypothetical protein
VDEWKTFIAVPMSAVWLLSGIGLIGLQIFLQRLSRHRIYWACPTSLNPPSTSPLSMEVGILLIL